MSTELDTLAELEQLLATQKSTFAWALTHASAGDPLPDAWLRCKDPYVMLSLAALVARDHAMAALELAALDTRVYPHARDCLTSGARSLRKGNIRDSMSWLSSALVHYPGRGTARPQPEKGRAAAAAVCDALRSRVSLTMDLL
ncbi:MAG: hypothetical protein Q8Q09_10725 [Deltaproteobacteria bacterium]|nr:hypothetical protein [Deltaproteobacteria bacterium]